MSLRIGQAAFYAPGAFSAQRVRGYRVQGLSGSRLPHLNEAVGGVAQAGPGTLVQLPHPGNVPELHPQKQSLEIRWE